MSPISDKEMTPVVDDIKKEVDSDIEMQPVLLIKSKSEILAQKEKHKHQKKHLEEQNNDISMEEVPPIKEERDIKQESKPKQTSKHHKKRSSKKRSKKSILLEYTKSTHELKVIISKSKKPTSDLPLPNSSENPMFRTFSTKIKSITLKSEVLALPKKVTSKKSLKLKTKRPVSIVKPKGHLSDRSKKTPVKKEVAKSIKRVLLKKIESKESKGRQLRSGTKLGGKKKEVKGPSVPRTRSQKKQKGEKNGKI
jgi:hypothetical protein